MVPIPLDVGLMRGPDDFLNWGTGEVDPRHLYGTTNQDVFRWPALTNGTQKMLLGMLVTNL